MSFAGAAGFQPLQLAAMILAFLFWEFFWFSSVPNDLVSETLEVPRKVGLIRCQKSHTFAFAPVKLGIDARMPILRSSGFFIQDEIPENLVNFVYCVGSRS